jgi:tetratricopeptide (TPR) repeat protein
LYSHFNWFAQGDLDAALDVYLEMLRIKPDSSTIHEMVAKTKEKLGDVDGAQSSFRHVIALAPATALKRHTFGHLARLLNSDRRHNEAEDALLQAWEVDPLYNKAAISEFEKMASTITLDTQSQYELQFASKVEFDCT